MASFTQQAPGARGTRLHRKIGDDRTLLAIASWDSKAARDAMEANPSEEVRRIIAEQKLQAKSRPGILSMDALLAWLGVSFAIGFGVLILILLAGVLGAR